jgi:hypothetical protein
VQHLIACVARELCGCAREQAHDKRSFVAALQVPYYNKAVNCVFAGLWTGILGSSMIMLVLQLTIDKQEDPAAYSEFMTNVSAALACGAVCPDTCRTILGTVFHVHRLFLVPSRICRFRSKTDLTRHFWTRMRSAKRTTRCAECHSL